MSIPDFQSLMLPVLTFAADGGVRTGAETVEHVATQFGLTSDECNELLPSGRARLINDRTHWALTYLRPGRASMYPAVFALGGLWPWAAVGGVDPSWRITRCRPHPHLR